MFTFIFFSQCPGGKQLHERRDNSGGADDGDSRVRSSAALIGAGARF
jgi:hypothetical protein|tara:strand:- start:267 stop:407 length:141 start_codon:yes stop_codon:yes gene_type:complete